MICSKSSNSTIPRFEKKETWIVWEGREITIEFISEGGGVFWEVWWTPLGTLVHPRKTSQNFLRAVQKNGPGTLPYVKISCGSIPLIHFMIRHRQPCENRRQSRRNEVQDWSYNSSNIKDFSISGISRGVLGGGFGYIPDLGGIHFGPPRGVSGPENTCEGFPWPNLYSRYLGDHGMPPGEVQNIS